MGVSSREERQGLKLCKKGEGRGCAGFLLLRRRRGAPSSSTRAPRRARLAPPPLPPPSAAPPLLPPPSPPLACPLPLSPHKTTHHGEVLDRGVLVAPEEPQGKLDGTGEKMSARGRPPHRSLFSAPITRAADAFGGHLTDRARAVASQVADSPRAPAVAMPSFARERASLDGRKTKKARARSLTSLRRPLLSSSSDRLPTPTGSLHGAVERAPQDHERPAQQRAAPEVRGEFFLHQRQGYCCSPLLPSPPPLTSLSPDKNSPLSHRHRSAPSPSARTTRSPSSAAPSRGATARSPPSTAAAGSFTSSASLATRPTALRCPRAWTRPRS